jgi:hypothetical protein
MLSQAFHASLGAEAIAASTPYVLIDLSDTTTYPNPHVDGDKTQNINLLSLSINAETHTTGIFDVWVGVIYEVDATNGSAQWFHVWHLEEDTNATDGAGHFADQIDYTPGNPEGLNCLVNTAGDGLVYMASNQEQAGNTNWQTDTTLTAASGTAVAPGAGDVVVWVEEVTNGGTIDFNITALYRKG